MISNLLCVSTTFVYLSTISDPFNVWSGNFDINMMQMTSPVRPKLAGLCVDVNNER